MAADDVEPKAQKDDKTEDLANKNRQYGGIAGRNPESTHSGMIYSSKKSVYEP